MRSVRSLVMPEHAQEWAAHGDDVARAVGMVMAQAVCPAERALGLLRACAELSDRGLHEVAVAVMRPNDGLGPAALVNAVETGVPKFTRLNRLKNSARSSIRRPAPNGTFVRQHMLVQTNKAEMDDFVVYLNEWYMGGKELGPYGEYHMAQMAQRAGIQTMFFEGDVADAAFYKDALLESRLEAMLETIDVRRRAA